MGSTFNISEFIQGVSFIYTQQFNNDTSKKTKRDRKNVNTKQLTVTHDAPKGPNFLPNNPAQKELINGKKINNRYINNFQVINPKIKTNHIKIKIKTNHIKIKIKTNHIKIKK